MINAMNIVVNHGRIAIKDPPDIHWIKLTSLPIEQPRKLVFLSRKPRLRELFIVYRRMLLSSLCSLELSGTLEAPCFEDLADFIKCYNPANRHQRKQT